MTFLLVLVSTLLQAPSLWLSLASYAMGNVVVKNPLDQE